MVVSFVWITAFEFWSCKGVGDTGAHSEMTHYTLIELRPAAGEARRDKMQFVPFTRLA